MTRRITEAELFAVLAACTEAKTIDQLLAGLNLRAADLAAPTMQTFGDCIANLVEQGRAVEMDRNDETYYALTCQGRCEWYLAAIAMGIRWSPPE